MNTNIFERLKKVKALALDVDGVLTDGAILVTDDGQQLRQFNIKDGYALKKAADTGLPIIIISA